MRPSLGNYRQWLISKLRLRDKKSNLPQIVVACFGYNICLKALSMQKTYAIQFKG